MLTAADGIERAGWVIKNRKTGIVLTSDICESEREARDLRLQQHIHQPHRGEYDVVPVLVTIREVKR